MAVETEVWATVITDLVAELDALFAAVPEREWESPAANVGWSCWRTADHVSGVAAIGSFFFVIMVKGIWLRAFGGL
jgi:hypothetical protein